MATMWNLVDYKENAGSAAAPHFSTKSHTEYDCAGKRSRTLYLSEYSGNMAGGKVIASGSGKAAGWSPVSPDTAIEYLWNSACGKAKLNDRPTGEPGLGSEVDPGKIEWKPVGRGGPVVLYVDPSSIRKEGKMVKMAMLLDYKEPRAEAYGTANSMMSIDEYDCAGNRSRTLYVSEHPGNMGQGKAIAAESRTGDWVQVPPGALSETASMVACGKTGQK